MTIDWMTFTADEAAVFTPEQFSTFVVDPVSGTVYRVTSTGVYAPAAVCNVFRPNATTGVCLPRVTKGLFAAGAEELGVYTPGDEG